MSLSLEQAMSSRRFIVGGGGGATGTPVDMAINFESGTNGNNITVADLNAGTLATSAGAGTWTIPNNIPIISTTSNFDPTPRKLKVGGTTQNEGTRNMSWTMVTPDLKRILYTLTTAAPQASCGFAWFHNHEGTSNFYNFGELTGTNGSDLLAMHMDDQTASTTKVSSEDNLSALGSLITIPNNQWYWVTMFYDNTNNIVKLRVYDPSASWAQVGAESTTSPTMSTDCNRLWLGRTDAHGVFGTVTMRCDCAGLALSTGVGATFPLLPT